MKKSIILLASLIWSVTASGFHPPVRNFSRKTYAAGTQNWSIVQNDGHCIYFANNDGILEFDGEKWTLYPTGNRTNVRSLMFDNENATLYAGATAELGMLHENADRRLVYESRLDSAGLDVSEIWKIHKVGNDIFFQDNNSIYRLDGKGTKQYNFNSKLNCSAVVGGELLVCSEQEGLRKLVNGEFEWVVQAEELRGKKVCAILPYRGEAMFVTETDGIYLLSRYGIRRFSSPLDNQINKELIFCAQTNGRYLALGSISKGAYVLDTETGEHVHVDMASGLQNTTVLSMLFDNSGNLWLGLDNGISQVLLNAPEMPIFSENHMYGSGYASAVFRNKLYLGTNQGLYSMDFPRDADPRSWKPENVVPVEAVKVQVWNLAEIDNTLFCSHDHGLFIINGDGTSYDVPLNGVWKVEKLSSAPGKLLGCTYDRMFTMTRQGGRWRFDGYLNGFEETSKAFEEDKDGKIWFSHWVKGLYRLTFNEDMTGFAKVERFTEKDGFPTRRSNVPNKTSKGIVFTTEGGFFRFDSNAGKAVPIDELNGLFTKTPVAARMYESPYGDRYFSSGGLQTIEYTDPSGAKVIDSLSLKYLCRKRQPGFDDTRALFPGQILVNTEDGFSIIRLDRLHKISGSNGSKVFIKNVYITAGASDSLILSSRSPRENAGLHLPYKHNSLRFEFICPDFSGEKRIEYSYMLENYDGEWTRFGEVNSKEYTRLSPGRYVFRVRSRDRFGPNASESSVRVSIDAPWYLTPLAYVLYALSCFVLIIAGAEAVRKIAASRERKIAEKREEDLRKEQLRHDLENKAENLAASTMNVIRKNEILMKIDSDLNRVSEMIGLESPDSRSLRVLKGIRYDIRENIEHDNDWQKFQQNFDIAYEDYLRRLGEKYPHLSINDKKLCAYLKMGLSSKEISPLLNMTLRSCEMARHRLRHKLGLSRDTNLSDFLQRF